MPKDEFIEIQRRNWTPVELTGNAKPKFLSRLPAEKAFRFLASGQESVADDDSLVGGIDVYRLAPDDPVNLNKDWYAVRRAAGDSTLRVEGPFKDDEHWLNEVPQRYVGVEVLGIPTTSSQQKAEPANTKLTNSSPAGDTRQHSHEVESTKTGRKA
jgi:hypothetical protein